ncbi:MAG: ABC transporter ATP-binding protein [Ardenticatenaceae bacterium]|nr:ABC transporter ATP-binding protein [Ardenticatenaceae bacterium]
MTEEPVIRFENVSKRFEFKGQKPQTILETITGIFSRTPKPKVDRDLWALQDVSFDVMPGECVGLIGRNGSGKSTALKLVARILRPAAGAVMVRGRVSALLELGAGFHNDLTGRENIFLNASVLGLTEAEIAQRFDEIVAFSELAEFIDMPVKHYSSGMYMRLGFSVAIHVSPDILIVDEVLAVGDQAFQGKCIDRIYEMKRQGTTILIVSHNLETMRKLCTHLVWLENGRIRMAGMADEVAEAYNEAMMRQGDRQFVIQNGSAARRGSREVEITAVRLLDGAGVEQEVFETGRPLTVEMAYVAHKAVPNPEFGLAIYRQDGTHVNGPNTRVAGLQMGMVEGKGVVRYEIECLPLLPARYLLTTAVHDSRTSWTYDYHQQAYSFRVTRASEGEVQGLIEMPASWHWQSVVENE